MAMARPMDAPRRRRRVRITPLRIIVTLLLLAAIVAGTGWWLAGRWTPPQDRYAMQGMAIDGSNGEIDWGAVQRLAPDFVYIAATSGTDARDPAFAANWHGARGAGLRYGAVHGFSLCRLAADQAGSFIATVQRDNAALPPVVALAFDPGCTARPSRDLVLAELHIFLSAIEAHSGKPAILRIAADVEDAYRLSAGINRTIWLDRQFLPPDYAAHPWVMWTANRWRRVDGVAGDVDWTVVAP